jgi:hypothetical protein
MLPIIGCLDSQCPFWVPQQTPRRPPSELTQTSASKTAKAKRVAEAMLKMVKFDITGLEPAARG